MTSVDTYNENKLMNDIIRVLAIDNSALVEMEIPVVLIFTLCLCVLPTFQRSYGKLHKKIPAMTQSKFYTN